MHIPPGSARASSRAATLTPSPNMSCSSTITSPRLTPMRKVMRLSSGVSALRSAIPRWTSAAHRTASTTLENSASIPSPVFFTIRPRCSLIFGSTRSQRCAFSRSCVPSSSSKQFSVTSGTIFHSRQLPIRDYLAAVALFCNNVKGISALALGRDLNVQYKTAFVLAHKLRETMSSQIHNPDEPELSGTVEVDGAYFGGHVKPEN